MLLHLGSILTRSRTGFTHPTGSGKFCAGRGKLPRRPHSKTSDIGSGTRAIQFRLPAGQLTWSAYRPRIEVEIINVKTTGNTILITGGGSGIGRELAQQFNQLGNTVIVAGRRMVTLEATIAGRRDMHAMVLDINDSEAIVEFADLVRERHPRLNVLINNAGIMRREDLTRKRDLHDATQTVTTNLLAPIRLTNELIDHLAGQADAAIVNVTSGLAFVPMSSTPTYNATKAAIHSYTVSLREQLKGIIEVIELTPPAVQTELTPGQSTREGYMPLDAFIDEVMGLFLHQPTPKEILVERVNFLRWAERDGRFDDAVKILGAH